MKLDKKTMHNLEFLIVFAVAAVVIGVRIDAVWKGLFAFLHLLMPFLLGAAFAFVINVTMSFLERLLFSGPSAEKYAVVKKISRPASLLLSILLWIGILVLVVSFLIPQVGAAGAKLITTIQAELPEFERFVQQDLLADHPDVWKKIEPVFAMQPDWNEIFTKVGSFLKSGTTELMSSTVSAVTSFAGTVISSITTAAVGMVFACYLLMGKEKYGRQLKKMMVAFLPQKATEKITKVATLSYTTFSRFITGQCLEACILGSIFFVVLSVGGFPYALLISVVIAFTALIPVFGAFIGCALGVFLILTESPVRALVFIVVFLVIQQVEGNLIYPRVVGGSIGLPGIWTLAAVTVGGSMFGILGMLLFIPLTSVVYKLLREEVNERFLRKTASE